jgi:putative tryptophan/tyrosine transport system substrate-binding protein
MKRREFIAGLGGAAVWPLTARAQQRAMPVVGYLSGVSERLNASEAFRKGLEQQGYVEGRNVEILYHFAEGRFVGERVGAVLVGASAVLADNAAELVALAAHYRLPVMYQLRVFDAAGGLMSYTTDLRDAFRVVGVYTGRILKGEKPADLPVQQVTKMQLSINMKTAKALGLTIPPNLLALADEVIE